jgi:hypothetical protein
VQAGKEPAVPPSGIDLAAPPETYSIRQMLHWGIGR